MTINTRPGLELVPAYRQGKAASPGASKLSSNESPHPPLDSVIDAVTARLSTINRYPEIGAAHLREAIADKFGLTAKNIALGAGSVEVAAQIIHAVAGPEDEVIFAWRSFEAYPSLVRIAGAVPVQVDLDAASAHDLPAMLAAITERTKLIFICNPNNPTGTVVDAQKLDDFVNAVPRDVLVVIDEAYVHFDRSPVRADGLALFAKYPHVAVLHTFSKAYGLAGLRVGYAIAPEEVAQNLSKVAIPFAVTDLAQVAAVASLEAESELAARIDEVVVQRERLLQGLLAAGHPAIASQANFVWVQAGDTSAELEAILDAGGVVVRTFAGEGVRISAGTVEEVDRVLRAVAGKGAEVTA